jgi:starch synthase
VSFDVHRGKLPGSDVPVYLIGNDRFFNRSGIYVDSVTRKDYPDQAARWVFFQRAALELLRIVAPDLDVIHCHDHQTGLIPAYLARLYRPNHAFLNAATVFTIHNLGYQGLFPMDAATHTGLNLAEFYPGSGFEFYGLLNFMKAGISFADIVTTVSETYAREIRESADFGYGLEGVLSRRGSDLIGILNGIDYEIWNPETDPLIPGHYTSESLKTKKTNRQALLARFGFVDHQDWPVLGMISRIEGQKGFDLITAILDELLADDVYFILLGSGNPEIEARLRAIIQRHSDRAVLNTDYDNDLAHLIEAGADIFLMPSRYEPCGLNQMYSMRYGTAPVVRRTGGLADTVEELEPSSGAGTGFLFDAYEPAPFRSAIDRAIACWRRPELWRQLMINGMAKDFSWVRSAKKYLEAYRQALARHRK